jgi:hypothetical protein
VPWVVKPSVISLLSNSFRSYTVLLYSSTFSLIFLSDREPTRRIFKLSVAKRWFSLVQPYWKPKGAEFFRSSFVTDYTLLSVK